MTGKRIVFKLLGVAAGVAFVVAGMDDRSSITRVKAYGRTAIVDPIEGYTSHKSRGSTTYTSEFTFKTETGQQITRKQSFPQELIADFKSNTPVKVYYNPGSPSEFVFEKEQPSWLLVGGGILIALLALALA